VQYPQRRNTKFSMVTIALVVVALATLAFGGTVPTPCVATVETVGAGVYWDSGCSNRVSSIEWGTIEAGSVKMVTVYVRNEGDVAIGLSLGTKNWSPSTASNYISLDWSYAGETINPNQVIPTTLKLSISPNIKGITTFSFDIMITCVEAASSPPTPPPPSSQPPPPDITPPRISITSPEPHILIASTSVMVHWAGADDESGIDHYSVYLNNKPVINTTDISRELLGLVEGLNNVTVMAYDKEGNFASDQIGIIVDITPPSVEVTSPKGGYVTMGTDVTVEWIGSDKGSGISHYRVYLDDAEVAKTTSTSCLLTALSEGDHMIKVEAYDLLNHTSSDKITITIHKTAPVAEIRKPIEKAHVKGTCDIVIYGLDVDFHLMNLYIDEALINAWREGGTQTYAVDTTTLNEGTHTIKLIVYDEAGKALEDTVTVTVDNTAPKAWIDAPSPGAELTGIQNIRFTASDAYLAGVLLYIDNTALDVSGETSYEWDTSGVNDGFHAIKILATDEAGNTGETQITVKTINTQKEMESRNLLLITGVLSVSVIGPIIVFAILFMASPKSFKSFNQNPLRGLSKWLSSKLFNVTEAIVGKIQNENQVREEEHQKSSEETSPEACPHSFGYLRTLPRNDPIPDECLICMKVIQCMNRHTT